VISDHSIIQLETNYITQQSPSNTWNKQTTFLYTQEFKKQAEEIRKYFLLTMWKRRRRRKRNNYIENSGTQLSSTKRKIFTIRIVTIKRTMSNQYRPQKDRKRTGN
jgi:hypothetical protein